MFEDALEHRTHYQSDWHCYNLKRKVAQLQPLTEEAFQERKTTVEIDNKKVNKGVRAKKQKKQLEKKTKELDMGIEQGIGKWKSGDNPRFRWFCERSAQIEAEEDDGDWSDCSDDEGVKMKVDQVVQLPEEPIMCILDGVDQRDIPIEECTFCGHISVDADINIKHMEDKHSFYVPSKEHLSDGYGLLKYINRKVGVGNICVTCNENGKSFYSLTAVRDHMLKQGHVQVLMTGERAFEYSEYFDFPDSDEEDDEIDEGNVGEMVLANGAVIGHRSMWKYYKQSFDPRMALVPTKRANQINKYRAIGWHSAGTQMEQLKDFKRVAKWTRKNIMRVELLNNKNDNMRHFVRRDGFCM